MRTNNPPPPTPGPISLPRRPITLNSMQYHVLMAALIDYDKICRGSIISVMALEIGERLAPEGAAR